MVQHVDVDLQDMVVREPGKPLERDAGIGVFGHLVELVCLAAAGRHDLHDNLDERGRERSPVIGRAVEQGVRAADTPQELPVGCTLGVVDIVTASTLSSLEGTTGLADVKYMIPDRPDHWLALEAADTKGIAERFRKTASFGPGGGEGERSDGARAPNHQGSAASAARPAG